MKEDVTFMSATIPVMIRAGWRCPSRRDSSTCRRRTMKSLFTSFLCGLSLFSLMIAPTGGSEELTDEQKLERITELCRKYKRPFPNVPDVSAEDLIAKGFIAYNLRGSILAWIQVGQKLVSDGEETRRVHVYGRRGNLGPKGYEAVW